MTAMVILIVRGQSVRGLCDCHGDTDCKRTVCVRGLCDCHGETDCKRAVSVCKRTM